MKAVLLVKSASERKEKEIPKGPKRQRGADPDNGTLLLIPLLSFVLTFYSL